MKILRAICLLLPIAWALQVQADDTNPSVTPTQSASTKQVMVLKDPPKEGDNLKDLKFEPLEIEEGKYIMSYRVMKVSINTFKSDVTELPIQLATELVHDKNGMNTSYMSTPMGVLIISDDEGKIIWIRDLVYDNGITRDEAIKLAVDDVKINPDEKVNLTFNVFRTDTTLADVELETPTTVFEDDGTFKSFETYGYTASEKELTWNGQAPFETKHEDVIKTERSISDDEVKEEKESILIRFPKLQATKTGYGIPVNVDVTFAGNLPDLKMTRHKDLLADYNTDYDQTQEVMARSAGTATNTTHFQAPQTYVQRDLLGTLWSANQVNRPADTVDGGNKLYVPVWFDFENQHSDVTIESTQPIGVNQWTIKLTQAVEVNAFMYVSIGSPTLLQDELLIQPIFTHSFYEQYKDKNWFVDPVADTAWIMSDDF